MATDDDVIHAEIFHGEFNGRGGGVGIAHGGRGRDDVADVFYDEQVAGLAMSNEFSQDTGIRAGNEKRVRILSDLRETAKEFAVISKLIIAEFVDALD